MSTENETITEAPVETPAEPSTEQLDHLLSEFKSAEVPEEQPAEQPEQPQQDFSSWAMDVETERQERREAEDVGYAFSRAKEVAAGYQNLSDNFGETWLRNEYMTNAELQQAWDNRLNSDEAMHHANRVLKRAMKKLAKEAEHEDSRIAGIPVTADRAAVAHAVRGNAGPAPESGAPSFSGMSDAQFKADVKKRYGFVPNI